jgi:hypothetical protein
MQRLLHMFTVMAQPMRFKMLPMGVVILADLLGCSQQLPVDDPAPTPRNGNLDCPAQDSLGCIDETWRGNYCTNNGGDCSSVVADMPYSSLSHLCYRSAVDVADPDGRGGGRVENLVAESHLVVPRLLDDHFGDTDELVMRQVLTASGDLSYAHYYRNGVLVLAAIPNGSPWISPAAPMSAAFTLAAFWNNGVAPDSLLYATNCSEMLLDISLSASCAFCRGLTYFAAGTTLAAAAAFTGGAAIVLAGVGGVSTAVIDKSCEHTCDKEHCRTPYGNCVDRARDNECRDITLSSLTPAQQRCQDALDVCWNHYTQCLDFHGLPRPQ